MTTVGEFLDLTPEPWMALARCAETDPEQFFPEKGGPATAAKAVCRTCPVTDECLQFALTHNERHGVWGAKSEQQRRRIRSSRATKRSAA